MRKIREILRLRFDADLSVRAIVRSGVAARSTVQELFRRFEASGLVWPLSTELDDAVRIPHHGSHVFHGKGVTHSMAW